jgi:tripartite-type tricarboxylate transporter receptor subunit TctC
MAGLFQVALVVAPSTGVTSLAEYFAWLKSNPEARRSFGTSAADDYLRLYMLAIGRECGVDLQYRPQKGAAGLVAAVKAGEVPAGIVSVPTLLDHNRRGEVRVLVTSGATRSRVLRTVPTAAEAGHPALELAEWFGFFASSVTPPAVAAEWSSLLQAVLAEEEVAAQLATYGLDVAPTTQAEARTLYTERLKTWLETAAALGVKLPE